MEVDMVEYKGGKRVGKWGGGGRIEGLTQTKSVLKCHIKIIS